MKESHFVGSIGVSGVQMAEGCYSLCICTTLDFQGHFHLLVLFARSFQTNENGSISD